MGGFTPSNWPIGAMVGKTPEAALANRMAYRHLDLIIDYHIPLLPRDAAAIGDSVVFPTYAQMHMSRSQIVPVSGIQSGNPRVWGVFDQAATMVDRDWNPVPPDGPTGNRTLTGGLKVPCSTFELPARTESTSSRPRQARGESHTTHTLCPISGKVVEFVDEITDYP